mgnify:CR=1 FL=1
MSKSTLEQLCQPLNVELADSEKIELFDKKQNELDKVKEEHKALEQEFKSYESSLESARVAFSDLIDDLKAIKADIKSYRKEQLIDEAIKVAESYYNEEF